MCTAHDPSLPGWIEGKGQRQGLRWLSVYRTSTFLLSCYQLRACTTRRAAWRGQGQRQYWSPAHVGVVTRTD